jgi:hypothetical protein
LTRVDFIGLTVDPDPIRTKYQSISAISAPRLEGSPQKSRDPRLISYASLPSQKARVTEHDMVRGANPEVLLHWRKDGI